MKQYFSIINQRTLITSIISLVVPFFCYTKGIIYNIDLTLISIAIIFPLVFAIRGAFKRREKALEHLSKMKSALIAIQYLIGANNKMSKEEQQEGFDLCASISDRFIEHLEGATPNKEALDGSFQDLVSYMERNPETISNGLRTKINGVIQKVHEGMENALAIHIHRTPISLKAYCKVFIYIFPLIYTPTIINKIGLDNPAWITYFVVILSEFILISLYNIQDDMEYPFDHKGLDDIKLENFRVKK